jgi:hypothetical protein
MMVIRKAVGPDSGRGPNDTSSILGAKTAEPALAQAVYDGLLWAATIPSDTVLETRNAGAILSTIPWGELGTRIHEGVVGQLQTVIGRAAANEAGVRPGLLQKDVTTAPIDAEAFVSIVDPYAVAYAEQQSGRLIVSIQQTMRTMIQSAVIQAALGNTTAGDIAAMLRYIIPLHDAWASAVQKTYARTITEQLAAGASYETARKGALSLASSQAKRLQKARAWNIARTETMTAANQGKHASWAAGVQGGWIGADSLKIWEEGRDPCRICAPLVGELRRWDEPFSNGDQMPPGHPGCRCTGALVPADPEYLSRMAAQRSESGWEPVMSRAEAEAYVAGTSTPGEFYHGTKPEAYTAIQENGFDPSRVQSSSATSLLGDGIYLSGVKAYADEYAWTIPQSGGKLATVTSMVKTTSPINVLDIISDPTFKGGTFDPADADTAVAQSIAAFAKEHGHDAVYMQYDEYRNRMTRSGPITEIVVFGPKQIVVVNDAG